MAKLKDITNYAAGIDIGSKEHFVAIDTGEVRSFSAFTDSLEEIAKWLKESKVETIAMESTGVYWIPLFELLESKGFDVNLVDARQAKNLPGKKSDVMDCQWLQQLHSYGLLAASFRPRGEICVLRALVRQRDTLTKQAATEVLHMQKALDQMNIKLHKVVRYITGVSGMNILRAILAGERNPKILASLRHKFLKSSEEQLVAALTGNYREEHLFVLQQSLELYDFLQEKISVCDQKIQELLDKLDESERVAVKSLKKAGRKKKEQPITDRLIGIFGVDLTKIPGVSEKTALVFASEVGSLVNFKSSKHFASWLGLCPGSKVSGGKILNSRSRNVKNRLAQALRMSANALFKSKSGLGSFFRRMRAKHGAPKAITATAHKIARIIFYMITKQQEFVDYDQQAYLEKAKLNKIKKLEKIALELGATVSLP